MTTSSKPRLHRSPAQRTQILRAFRASGLSQGAFAAQAGIGLSTLQLWPRSARQARTETPSFVELPNPLPIAAAPPAYRLRLADGLVLELGRGWVPAVQQLLALTTLAQLWHQHVPKPRGQKLRLSGPQLVHGLVFHLLCGAGSFAAHVGQLTGVKVSDSDLSQRRAAAGVGVHRPGGPAPAGRSGRTPRGLLSGLAFGGSGRQPDQREQHPATARPPAQGGQPPFPGRLCQGAPVLAGGTSCACYRPKDAPASASRGRRIRRRPSRSD